MIEKIICENCEKEEATVRCTVCNVNFCEKCNQEAHSMKALQKHERIAIDLSSIISNISPICSKHNEHFKLLCLKCQTSICAFCTTQDHEV